MRRNTRQSVFRTTRQLGPRETLIRPFDASSAVPLCRYVGEHSCIQLRCTTGRNDSCVSADVADAAGAVWESSVAYEIIAGNEKRGGESPTARLSSLNANSRSWSWARRPSASITRLPCKTVAAQLYWRMEIFRPDTTGTLYRLLPASFVYQNFFLFFLNIFFHRFLRVSRMGFFF